MAASTARSPSKSPRGRDLQQWLGVIERKIDAIKQDTEALRRGQDAEAARNAVRQDDLMANLQKLQRLQVEAAGGGAAAVQAVEAIRDVLRQGNPGIDAISAEQIPGLVQRIIADLRKPAARPEDFTGTVRHALEQAQSQVDRLRFAEAQQGLDAALAQAAADDETRARGKSALLAERARVAALQLRYPEAAGFYARAAEAVAFDPAAAWAQRLNQADALQSQGDEFGDNQALSQAITAYGIALALAPRGQRRDDWATTQNNLGNALQTLGERESGTERLEEAVTAYRDALQECTRERVPLDWATTQNNLGTALADARGTRERHGAAGTGRHRLSRRAEGMHARARAARLGDDAEQPRQRA